MTRSNELNHADRKNAADLAGYVCWLGYHAKLQSDMLRMNDPERYQKHAALYTELEQSFSEVKDVLAGKFEAVRTQEQTYLSFLQEMYLCGAEKRRCEVIERCFRTIRDAAGLREIRRKKQKAVLTAAGIMETIKAQMHRQKREKELAV